MLLIIFKKVFFLPKWLSPPSMENSQNTKSENTGAIPRSSLNKNLNVLIKSTPYLFF